MYSIYYADAILLSTHGKHIQMFSIQILQVLTLIQSEGKTLGKSGAQKWTTSLECLIEYHFSKFTLFAIKQLNCLFSLSKLQQSFT